MAGASSPRRPLGLFEAFGVELEYMLVDAERLDTAPVADELLAAAQRAAGRADLAEAHEGDLELGPITWSNELCLHVLELKTSEPAATLEGLAGRFHESLGVARATLGALATDPPPTSAAAGRENSAAASPRRRARARLLGGAMHPWMDPFEERRLWPHGYGEVYRLFDRIFDCRGHGWANLQSAHLNLPFASAERADDEFGRLHAAIRLILPILPALAASSPFMEGVATGRLDSRLDVYRRNSGRLPAVAGRVIPEPVYTAEAYAREIYDPIDAAIGPFDPQGLLDHAWVNARGAIARFDRGAIEIRVLDVQESPAADLAILAMVVAALRALTAERWIDLRAQQAFGVEPLAAILSRAIDAAETALIDDPKYLGAFGAGPGPMTAGALWDRLVEACPPPAEFAPAARVILGAGPLARRLLRAAGPAPDRAALTRLYRRLGDCLDEGGLFVP
ncbi:MAG TPA: glutamate-cysteine ligase family protein [Phycisphaerales bacterium]|nr:glutamate-cysteine ligase family protein [Phycisphaerales bacterium]HMP38447.1 glutamate-cysteine ligase family protein [Phycisphaerales bacterium]